MSRPKKMHAPLNGAFNNILAAVAHGTGSGKRAAEKLAHTHSKPSEIQANRAKPEKKS